MEPYLVQGVFVKEKHLKNVFLVDVFNCTISLKRGC
jgi:hypothetical protein